MRAIAKVTSRWITNTFWQIFKMMKGRWRRKVDKKLYEN
jgi:hypothetical protein